MAIRYYYVEQEADVPIAGEKKYFLYNGHSCGSWTASRWNLNII